MHCNSDVPDYLPLRVPLLDRDLLLIGRSPRSYQRLSFCRHCQHQSVAFASQHRIWRACKLRVHTVAEQLDNSVAVKANLQALLQQVRALLSRMSRGAEPFSEGRQLTAPFVLSHSRLGQSHRE